MEGLHTKLVSDTHGPDASHAVPPAAPRRPAALYLVRGSMVRVQG
jgi:hypothetical protein